MTLHTSGCCKLLSSKRSSSLLCAAAVAAVAVAAVAVAAAYGETTATRLLLTHAVAQDLLQGAH
jgi:hypothetical protein